MFSRTYTPPTCTLKVKVRGLALLTWFGMPRKQQFSLSFDDPRVSEAEHIKVRGDRRELDTLHEVVTTYVQEFLDNSPNLPLEMENTGVENDSNIPSQSSDTKIQEDTTEENTIESGDAKIVNPYSQPPIKNQNIYVQPRDLLTHDLFLGSLANKESGKFISLSMLQLFDLAIALDECQNDLQRLPQFESNKEVKGIPEWLRTAILILITAGLTAAGIKLYNRYAISQQKQNEIATSDSTTDNNQSVPQTSPTPIPLPTPTVPASPLPTPPTNLPTTTIIKPSPIPTPSPLFPTPSPPAPPAPNNLPPPDFSRTPQNQGNATTFVIPQAPPLTPPPVPPAAIPNYGVPVQSRFPAQPPPSLQTQPAPNQAPLPNINRRRAQPYFDVSRIPVNVPRAINLPPLQDVDPVAVRDIPNTVEPSNESNETKKSKYTLFDKIPQVAEVREYFQKNWQPPSGLDKDLQYSLLLNGDGSVNKVTPISRASVEFYGNTNMPLEDQAFVSNIEGGKTAKIRLVLSRDGEVKTFLESLN